MKPMSLSGAVTPFAGNGRKLGYPTANLAVETSLQDGVYFGFASLGRYKNHQALIFVGTPTTVGDTVRRVEAHLLDIPDTDYYDQKLKLDIRYYFRPNQTFASVELLLEQMAKDERAAHQWFDSFK